MKQLRNWLAGFLCLCMVLTTGSFPAMATEQPEVVTRYAATTDATASDSVNVVEDDSDAETEETESREQGQTPGLSYLVLGSNYIKTPGSQYVVAGVGDEDTVLTTAVLHYKNNTTGQEYTRQADAISENAALFNLEFDDNMTGSYSVTSVEAEVEGTTASLEPSDVGIDAAFGVNQEVNVNPDAWISQDTGESGIIVTDGEGNELSSDDVAAAIAEIGAESSLARAAKKGEYIIVLDPGHGGTDGGASGNGVVEKAVNLKIATYCKKELEKYAGVKVYMTRTTDVYLGLAERTEYANTKKADLFISIHNNAAESEAAHGANVYYPNDNYKSDIGAAGQKLAAVIQKKLVALGLYDGGIHIRNSESGDTYEDGSLCDYYAVIRAAKKYGFPGLIIEHAFITNADDAATYLSSNASLKKLGVADAKAIASYLGVKKTVAVTGVELNKSSKTLVKGKTYTLKATVSPSNATNQKVTWESSDTKVAKVSSSGKVTAVAKGTATITCTTKDGKKVASCKITVTQPVTKIKLNKTKATLKKGKTLTLKATVSPKKASNKKVTWTSSNKKVATVSSKGKVTAKKKGTATITCTAADGSNVTAKCKITVK